MELKRLISVAGVLAVIAATVAVVAVLVAGGSGDSADTRPATQRETADDAAAEPRDGSQATAPLCVEGVECEDLVVADGGAAPEEPDQSGSEEPVFLDPGVCDDGDMRACEELAVGVTVADLADRLGVDEASVGVVSVEFTEWSDTSLGNPQPGFLYAQVITPGFKIILEAGGQSYEYHTDLRGNFTFVD